MKRGIKAESIDDDDFLDEQLGSPYSNFCSSDRKKRRGIIEKRRRDRINTSLSDLKRLVPDACTKQNSAKLEKAEILQITVDFLRRLHQEGYVLMAETRAAENRRLGYHECLTEVSRFISTQSDVPMNGVNSNAIPNYIEDFKRRLINHLQMVAQKRDSDMKSYLESTAMIATEMTRSQQPQQQQQQPQPPSQNRQQINSRSSSSGNNTSTSFYNTSTEPSRGYHNSYYDQNASYQHQTTGPADYRQHRNNNNSNSDTNSSPSANTNLHQSLSATTNNNNNLTSLSSIGSGGLQNESQSTTSPSLVGTLEETEISTSGTPPNIRPSLHALMSQVYNQDSIKLDPPFECSSPTKSEFWLDSQTVNKKSRDDLDLFTQTVSSSAAAAATANNNSNHQYFYNQNHSTSVYNYFINDTPGNQASFYQQYPDYYNHLVNGTHSNSPPNFPIKQHLT